MTEIHAARLAARFRDDAQALRARATSLDAQTGKRPGGPTADASRHMADACEKVALLFAGAETDDALAATIPTLARLLAEERAADTKHVYEGAITRVRQALGDDDDDDAFDEDEEEEEEYDA